MRPFLHTVVAGLLLVGMGLAQAFEPFVVKEIEVEGLQRISAGTVFNYLPIKKGDRVDEADTAKAVRELYKTGFFRDVALEREDDNLVVFVEERPAISSIEFEGNEDIPTEELLKNLKQIGFAQGRIFDRSMLDKVKQELKRQYLARGKYGVQIESTVTPLPRNRVSINVAIAEGDVATIRRVNIVGNTVFPEEELLERFELGTTGHFAFFSDRDQYSKQRLSGDLETLRSYYMDRGYINFNVESTQVSITPDRSGVYITINIHEGERHTVESVTLAGDTVVAKEELRKLVSIEAGDVFSRTRVTESSNRISERLGEAGYAFANVNAVP
ncbi:MAG TPA: outer membrane protein assembly factor BamA, partial [Gammaproteobacteria bacterium]|nr:outer membrane protein assembly factor BamA [Gammaproteobacteria bacterium]